MTVAKPLIFISHIHEEAELANALKARLSHMLLGGVNFFASSDRESIRGGDDWLIKIKDAISNACIVIVLVSPRSINRTWINFEAGAGWLHHRVVPICHSGMQPSQLPKPLQHLYSFDIEDPYDLRDLCQLVAESADLHIPEEDWGELSKQLRDSALNLDSSIIQPYGASSCWVFPRSEDLRTITSLEKSLHSCKEAWFYSIGLNFFWNAGYLQVLEDRISEGEMRAQICMANFNSQVIVNRLEEEPEHPIGIPGTEYLVKRLLRLESRINDRSRLSLNLFDHYPTYAMLVFDDEIYVYPYGFKALGNFSPTFYWKGKDPAIQFFKDQFVLIWGHSIPATEIYGQTDTQC
jgi:hypothetical protein